MITKIKKEDRFDLCLKEILGDNKLEDLQSSQNLNKIIITGLDGAGKSYLVSNLIEELNKNVEFFSDRVKSLRATVRESYLFTMKDDEYFKELQEAIIFDRHPLTDFPVYSIIKFEKSDRNLQDSILEVIHNMNWFYLIKDYKAIFIDLDDRFVKDTVQPDYVWDPVFRESTIYLFKEVAKIINKLYPEINIYVIEED